MNSPGLPSPPRAHFHSLPLLEKTAAQVAILRGVVDIASGVLAPLRNSLDGAPVEDFDAESRNAAKKTLILAFHQLDNVLDDQIRWGSDLAPLEAEALRLIKAETDKAVADAKLRTLMAQPFQLLQGQVYRAASGRVMATNSTGAIEAWGDSPKEAVENFNLAFESSAAASTKPKDGGGLGPTSASSPENPKAPRKPRKKAE